MFGVFVLSVIFTRNPFGNNIPKKFSLIKERQKAFNIDNGLRVHERGKSDAMIYNFTLVVLALGSVEFCRTWWVMAYPNGFR